MPPTVSRTARRLERRAFEAVYLSELALSLTVMLFVAGAVLLLLKALFGLESARLASVLALAGLAPIVAWVRASRKRLSPEAATAWLDVRCGASGTLVTGVEAPDARWARRVESILGTAPALPRPRLKKPLAMIAVALGFALLAFWVRIPRAEPGPSPALFDARIERLEEQLESLEETVVLDEELREEMRERLRELAAGLEESDPESNYEALDQLADRLRTEAARARESAERANDALNTAALNAGGDPEAAREGLESALEEMRLGGLAAELPEDLAERLASVLSERDASELDASELLELSDELRELLEGRLGELVDASLLSGHELIEAGDFADLADLSDHVCDEECKESGT